MTTYPSVRHLLDRVAEEAPTGLPPDAAADLCTRVRRGRRARPAAVGVAAVATVAALTGLLATLVPDWPGASRPAPGPGGPGRQGDGAPGSAAPLGCADLDLPPAADPGPLEVTLARPPTTAPGGRLRGVLTLANRGTQRIRGTTDTDPTVVLVSGGRVVAVPSGSRDSATRVDLPPGGTMDLPFTVLLRWCDPAGREADTSATAEGRGKTPVPEPSGRPIPAGAYDLLASVAVRVDGAGVPGQTLRPRGGPWGVRVG